MDDFYVNKDTTGYEQTFDYLITMFRKRYKIVPYDRLYDIIEEELDNFFKDLDFKISLSNYLYV